MLGPIKLALRQINVDLPAPGQPIRPTMYLWRAVESTGLAEYYLTTCKPKMIYNEKDSFYALNSNQVQDYFNNIL